MNFFSKLFGHNKSAKPEAQSDTEPVPADDVVSSQIKTEPVSSVNSSAIPEGSTILYQSEIPAYCSIGNLIYEKKYAEAIQMGLDLLKQTPNDPGVHINLMEAYFKSRESNPDYFDKSTHHAKLAMLCGHHTGLAEDRLAKNLDKCKLYHQSLQLYNLILDNPGFHFSSHGMVTELISISVVNPFLKKLIKQRTLRLIYFSHPMKLHGLSKVYVIMTRQKMRSVRLQKNA